MGEEGKMEGLNLNKKCYSKLYPCIMYKMFVYKLILHFIYHIINLLCSQLMNLLTEIDSER